MPRKKSQRNVGKNKKKLKSQKKLPELLEYEGYEIGQEVWVKLEIYGTEEWAFGAIDHFWPKDKIEPSFTFYDKIKKRFATGAVRNITNSPPKRWMAKMRG